MLKIPFEIIHEVAPEPQSRAVQKDTPLESVIDGIE